MTAWESPKVVKLDSLPSVLGTCGPGTTGTYTCNPGESASTGCNTGHKAASGLGCAFGNAGK